MKYKTCVKCGESKRDRVPEFKQILKGGGVWGTMATCRECYNKRAKERKEVKKIEAMIQQRDVEAV